MYWINIVTQRQVYCDTIYYNVSQSLKEIAEARTAEANRRIVRGLSASSDAPASEPFETAYFAIGAQIK
jgi:hypothetical protein